MVLTSVAFYGNVSSNGSLQDLHHPSSLPAAAGRDAGDYGHRSKAGPPPPPCFFVWPLEGGGGGHRPSHPRSTSSDTQVILWMPKFWDVISISTLTWPSFHLLMLICCHRRKGYIHCSLLSFLDGRALADDVVAAKVAKIGAYIKCFVQLSNYLVSIERAFFGTKNVVGFSTLVDLRHVRFILPYHYKYLGRVTVTISAFGICNDLWRRIQCGSHLWWPLKV